MDNMLGKSWLAGVYISVGCVVNLVVGGIAGAVLFSFGLFSICELGLLLFTGRIGYMDESNCWQMPVILFGNLLGTASVATVLQITRLAPTLMSASETIVDVKMGDTMDSLFVLAMLCGALMYTGVEIYKKSRKALAVVMAVSVFILSGYEHCIADMFYMFMACKVDWMRLLVIIFGNALGALIIRRAHNG